MTYLKDNRSIYAQAAQTNKLYKEFKREAAKHFVPVKVALREAMRLWIHHEMGDTEFTSYMSLHQDHREVKDRVKKLLGAESMEQLEEEINAITKEY